MRVQRSLRDRLLQISSQLRKQHGESPTFRRELTRVAKKLVTSKEYGRRLTPEHVKVFARLFHKSLTDNRRVEPLPLLQGIYGDLSPAIRQLQLIVDLIEFGIVECDEKRYWKVRQGNKTWKHRVDSASLVDVYIMVSRRLMSWLLNGQATRFDATPRPFVDNAEYLECWFKYVAALYESRRMQSLRMDNDEAESEAISALEFLVARTRATGRIFPFQQLCCDYQLSHPEQIVIIFALHQALDDNPASESDLRLLLSDTRYAKLERPVLLSENSTLLREGLIESVENNHLLCGTGDYEISPDVAASILNGQPRSASKMVEDMVRHDPLLALVSPKKKLGGMVLAPETRKLVHDALSLFRHPNIRRLADWGFGERTGQPGSEESARLVLLLYGAPGTGKTALAHAIAHKLKRPLLVTDISKILDKWIGESEKRLARLFALYRRIAKRAGAYPVLLLNEADQILSKRGGVESSADRMYNQMQNILLEQLEAFAGILLATTNLIENIDGAFSRRFDLKIQMPRPGLDERLRLWQTLIPQQLPLHKDVDLLTLARDYPFTGGQIETVIRNAASAAANRHVRRQLVCQADLCKYAKLETGGSFDNSRHAQIGFGTIQA